MIDSKRTVRRRKAREAVDVFVVVKNLALNFLDEAKGKYKKEVILIFEEYQKEWNAEMKVRNKLGKELFLKKEGLKEYVLGIEKHLKTIGCPIEAQKEYIKVIEIISGGKIKYLFRKLKNKINEKAN